MSCKECINYQNCLEKNTSFEFAEYGDKWAKWCEDFAKKQ